MPKRDYYEVLGVPRSANDDELKSAFRNLARQCHPDVSSDPDAEEKFKEINEAYAVLSDSEKRAAYDRFGHAGVNTQGMPDFSNIDLSDILEGLFGFGGFGGFGGMGGRRVRNAPRRGADPVSYTHLDVYKRQPYDRTISTVQFVANVLSDLVSESLVV